MLARSIYATLGLIIGAVLGLFIILITAGIQQHAFADQFNIQSLLVMAGLALVGLLLGYWLGKPLKISAAPPAQITDSEKPDTITITRAQAFWSDTKLKGKGLHLRDIHIIGSMIDIVTDSDLSTPSHHKPKDQPETIRSIEQLQFSAFYPKVVTVEKWHTLLFYTHITSALQVVRADASKFKEELGDLPGEIHAQATSPVHRGMEITLVPTCQGITFNPEQISYRWVEDWQQTRFRFRPEQSLSGTVGNGEIIIYANPLIIATLRMAFLFEPKEQLLELPRDNKAEVTASLYQKIFASYSHADTPVVLACRNAYKALGLDVLIDIDTLRAGQLWNEGLMKMIEHADIFQLFWSKHAEQSQYVRQEWQHALKNYKGEGFIRPVYWEKPLVSPPQELSSLHFTYIQLPKL